LDNRAVEATTRQAAEDEDLKEDFLKLQSLPFFGLHRGPCCPEIWKGNLQIEGHLFFLCKELQTVNQLVLFEHRNHLVREETVLQLFRRMLELVDDILNPSVGRSICWIDFQGHRDDLLSLPLSQL
jgi:hypothetical protein